MRLRWTLPAAEDLESVKTYLEQQHPRIAESTVRSIYRKTRALKSTLYLGRPGYRAGTRELPLAPLPYIII